MNNLFGPKYILQERASGYKSTTYALAEIVDNSVDASSSKIDVYFIDKLVGQKAASSKVRVDEILVCDNGAGMSLARLNTCLTLSEGDGRDDKRIGAFGVGLPKSSISQCRRVEVYSKVNDKGGQWYKVYLDIDELVSLGEPQFSEAKQENPDLSGINTTEYSTIIRWSNLDRVDYQKGSTLAKHLAKLFGRIYRYALTSGLTISVKNLVQSRSGGLESNNIDVLVYDPLFLYDGRSAITDVVFDAVQNPTGQYKHTQLGHLPEYNSVSYYKKYIEGRTRESGNLPLFMEYEDFFNVEKTIKLNKKTYKWKIKASYAVKDLTNPGLRSGGNTSLGREIGEKMDGSRNFKSGNIFFIRSNREIDFGHFGLYTATDNKNRWWTIEIHFDSDLDDLLGLSNNKQSIQFNVTKEDSLEAIKPDEELTIGAMKEHLWAQMTTTIHRAIKEMTSIHRLYAKQFRDQEKVDLEIDKGEERGPLPTIEPAVIEVLPKEEEAWTDAKVEDVTDFLKTKYMHLDIGEIKKQVLHFSAGKTKTLVLYAPNETGNLFELTERRGVEITLINTNHKFYENIIRPLKEHRQLSIFAIAIEMLISSQSLEMEHLMRRDRNKYELPLGHFIRHFSGRLQEFIEDSHIKINVDQFFEELKSDSKEEAK